MQRTITTSGVDFEVEFSEDGAVEAIYIGSTEVSDIIRGSVECQLVDQVTTFAATWFSEANAESAREMRRG